MIGGARARILAGPKEDGTLHMPRSPGYVLDTPMTPSRPPVSPPHDNGSGTQQGHGPPRVRLRRIASVFARRMARVKPDVSGMWGYPSQIAIQGDTGKPGTGVSGATPAGWSRR
ncbi:hypothetical protein GCM10009546_13430 [Actinomadura livida]|uniref:Uncharacterized protein n=1 Tax=Actinomadura livida TaxID=79909 RepID=A0ABN1DVJ2_9ACTN|nr:hypothetical protein GCM10010208_59890 [Actinomadura livida]